MSATTRVLLLALLFCVPALVPTASAEDEMSIEDAIRKTICKPAERGEVLLLVDSDKVSISKASGVTTIPVFIVASANLRSATHVAVAISEPANPTDVNLVRGGKAMREILEIKPGKALLALSLPIETSGANVNSGRLTYLVSLDPQDRCVQAIGAPRVVEVQTVP